MAPARVGIAVEAHDHHPLAPGVARQVLQELEARAVRPMQIVEHDGHWRDERSFPDKARHRPQEALYLLRAAGSGRGLGGKVVRQEPGEVRPAARRLFAQPGGRLLVERAQRLKKRVERDPALCLVATPGGHEEARFPGVYADLLGKPRLPDARLPRYQHHPPQSARDLFQRTQDAPQLLLPGNEARRRNRAEEPTLHRRPPEPRAVSGRLLRRTSGSRKLGPTVFGEPQGVYEPPDGLLVGGFADATFEVADGTRTEPGSSGKIFLGQADGCPVAPEHGTESG